MKLLHPSSILAFGTALVSVAAVPLRLIVVTNNQELADNIRFGHAVPNANVNTGVLPYRIAAGPDAHRPRPCMMRKLHNKAIEVSNAFRTALGLPPIELPGLDGNPTFGILPVGVRGSNSEVVPQSGARIVGLGGLDGPDYHADYPHHHHGHHGHHGRHDHKHHKHHGFVSCHKSPFLKRLSFAVMSLGPWEGRIVAFVLGCGLGVLLRMLWVLSLVTIRAIRGRRTEQTEYHHIIHEYEDLSPPPTYVYVDEKVDDKKGLEETRAT
ncbi:hypothetical protein APHAL10511_003812 [Amanita phalloides]|nr:hypothetical protein APHAL10511_003812 [Amanita phalloides]